MIVFSFIIGFLLFPIIAYGQIFSPDFFMNYVCKKQKAKVLNSGLIEKKFIFQYFHCDSEKKVIYLHIHSMVVWIRLNRLSAKQKNRIN
jgi:hypothetical protein